MVQDNTPVEKHQAVSHEDALKLVAAFIDPRANFKVPSPVQVHLATCKECMPAVEQSKAQYQRVAETCCGEPFI